MTAAVARLAEMVEQGKQVVRDHLPHTEASMDFHVAIAEASRNELLSATVRAYRDLLMQTLDDMRDVRSARATQKAHEEILEALRARDGSAAGKLMLEHLQDFEKRLRRYLQSKDGASDGRARRRTAVRTGRVERIERLRRASS